MRILVAESETVLGVSLETEFRAENYAVDRAVNGETTKSLARARHYDAAILDLHLPSEEGLEVFRFARGGGRPRTSVDDGHV